MSMPSWTQQQREQYPVSFMSMPFWPQQQHPVSFMSMPSWPQQQREQHPVSFMHKHAIFAITTRTTPCIIHEHAILATTTTPCIIQEHAILATTTTPCIVHEHEIMATIATGTTPCVIYLWACHLRHNTLVSFIREHAIFATATPCSLSLLVADSCGISRVSRIVGGTEASECEFPWAVVINVGTTFCGGSIIDSNTVLTAGHCVYTTWVCAS